MGKGEGPKKSARKARCELISGDYRWDLVFPVPTGYLALRRPQYVINLAATFHRSPWCSGSTPRPLHSVTGFYHLCGDTHFLMEGRLGFDIPRSNQSSI